MLDHRLDAGCRDWDKVVVGREHDRDFIFRERRREHPLRVGVREKDALQFLCFKRSALFLQIYVINAEQALRKMPRRARASWL